MLKRAEGGGGSGGWEGDRRGRGRAGKGGRRETDVWFAAREEATGKDVCL